MTENGLYEKYGNVYGINTVEVAQYDLQEVKDGESEVGKSTMESLLSLDDGRQSLPADDSCPPLNNEASNAPLVLGNIRQPSPPPPVKMMDDFLRLARENTAKNLETCGVLAGSLVIEKQGVPYHYTDSSKARVNFRFEKQGVPYHYTDSSKARVNFRFETSPQADHDNNALALIVLLQYVPRLYLIFPLSSQIIKANGVVTKTAWAGAAYNLLLYMLASHVLGASWYLLSVDQYTSCWKSVCKKESAPTKCLLHYLDCDTFSHDNRMSWAETTMVFKKCDPKINTTLNYGIFENAVTKNVVSSSFIEKYFYCLWWGLQNLRFVGSVDLDKYCSLNPGSNGVLPQGKGGLRGFTPWPLFFGYLEQGIQDDIEDRNEFNILGTVGEVADDDSSVSREVT
ncbi:hypothetical protein TEA_006663 [Camellia sinensis var. sinensis]|uniref:Uncharacterized protein n=1 Tax=Camellia sinensis var. sinensis TaxID=542762 RepID=A0A4S4DUF3_CAMSN|nr:hypothetical protein TEA_006663 [Camellia sinensis var. sinensis]